MAGGPKIPDPNAAAISGIETQAQLYPYEYLVNALAQEGGAGQIIDPITGQPTKLNFTGQGTADVSNQFNQQMAQTLLNIQQKYGPDQVTQALADLKQSDPNGYAAYGQLFDQIQKEAAQGGANLQLSKNTQDQIQKILGGSTSLTPEELTQVQQGVRGNQVASGIYLGNAPLQAESNAVVGAGDKKQKAAQSVGQQFLSSGVAPEDIQYRQLQQDMANLGAFINGQNPTAQFSSISGAQQQAAGYPNPQYTNAQLNEGQAAAQGVDFANSAYQTSQNEANPYLAGLNLGTQAFSLADTAYNGYQSSSYAVPQTQTNAALSEYYGAGTPGMAGASPDLPAIEGSTAASYTG